MAPFQAEWDDSSADGSPELVIGPATPDLQIAFLQAVRNADRLGYSRIRTEYGELVALLTSFQSQIVLTQGEAWCEDLEARAIDAAQQLGRSLKVIPRTNSRRLAASSSEG